MSAFNAAGDANTNTKKCEPETAENALISHGEASHVEQGEKVTSHDGALTDMSGVSAVPAQAQLFSTTRPLGLHVACRVGAGA